MLRLLTASIYVCNFRSGDRERERACNAKISIIYTRSIKYLSQYNLIFQCHKTKIKPQKQVKQNENFGKKVSQFQEKKQNKQTHQPFPTHMQAKQERSTIRKRVIHIHTASTTTSRIIK